MVGADDALARWRRKPRTGTQAASLTARAGMGGRRFPAYFQRWQGFSLAAKREDAEAKLPRGRTSAPSRNHVEIRGGRELPDLSGTPRLLDAYGWGRRRRVGAGGKWQILSSQAGRSPHRQAASSAGAGGRECPPGW